MHYSSQRNIQRKPPRDMKSETTRARTRYLNQDRGKMFVVIEEGTWAFTDHGDTLVVICPVRAKELGQRKTTNHHIGAIDSFAPLKMSINSNNKISIRGIVAMPRQACVLAACIGNGGQTRRTK